MGFIIYMIWHRENPLLCYIGGTFIGLAARWKQHLRHAREGSNSPLYRLLREFPDDFEIAVVRAYPEMEKTDYEDVCRAEDIETEWIGRMKSHVSHGGLNLRERGTGFRQHYWRGKLVRERNERIVRLYVEGNDGGGEAVMRIGEVARKVGVSTGVVTKALRAAGVSLKGRMLSEERELEMVRQNQEDYVDIQTLAERFNVRLGTARGVFYRRGAEPRMQGRMPAGKSFEIARLHIEGLSPEEIAPRARIVLRDVRAAIGRRRRDIDAWRAISESRMEIARMFVEEGMVVSAISRRTGIEPQRHITDFLEANPEICRIGLRVHGGRIVPDGTQLAMPPLRPPVGNGQPPHPQADGIARKFAEGVPAEDIVAEFGLINKNRVYSIASAMGARRPKGVKSLSPNRRKLSPEREADMVRAALEEFAGMQELEEEFGMSRDGVAGVLKRHGVEPPKRWKPVGRTPEFLDRIVRSLEAGKSVKDVAVSERAMQGEIRHWAHVRGVAV